MINQAHPIYISSQSRQVFGRDVADFVRMSGKKFESFASETAMIFWVRLKLYKAFKIKKRYLFTRNDTLRLRYRTCAYMACAALAVGAGVSLNARHDFTQQETRQQAEAAYQDEVQKKVSEGIRLAAQTIKKAPPGPTVKRVEIKSGDVLSTAIQNAGIGARDTFLLSKAIGEHYDVRTIKPGQVIEATYAPAPAEKTLQSLVLEIDKTKKVKVTPDESGEFHAELVETPLVKRTYAYNTEIQTSLYGSAARANIPAAVIAEMIRLYSWNVDFQRDIRKGDKIEVMYETHETEDGDFAKYGDIIYASLSVGGKDIPIYRYKMKNGDVDYFQPNGQSVRKVLMSTPVDGARLSSGFGMRKHPVLGYNKMHKGVDFAAPTGTPIYAAGDGTIEKASRNGGYGNYIRIRHNSKLKTAYAHLSKYARGITSGTRVKQGQVIGYIGTTGRSTGPHLHYEVLLNGKQVNPRSVDLPTGHELKGQDKQLFVNLVSEVQQRYAALTDGLKFARASDSNVQ